MMVAQRFFSAFLIFALCMIGLAGCKNTQRISGEGVVRILGYSNDDAPVGTVLVTTMGGGAPAVILAQQLDTQTESDNSQAERDKNIALSDNERITFDSLFLFERNSYQITPAMEENLSRIVRIMKKYENANVFIEGYTDDFKLKEHNLNLSEKRAKAIADYLVHKNIKSSRIQTRGYADNQPLFSNKSAQGKIKNRRVEVSIIARSGSEHRDSRK